MNLNRLANVHNKYQGTYKKVLCVCSAGLLRSPTAAIVLAAEPFNFNTRAAGHSQEYGLIVVDEVLLEWADEIVVMEKSQQKALKKMTEKTVHCLDIPDKYPYRNPELMELIKEKYIEVTSYED